MEENKEKDILSEEDTQTSEADQVEDTAAAEETDAEVQIEEPSEDSDEEEPKKKGLFGKKKKDKRDTQIEELTDRVQRQMAEFDNFRKRSEKEKAAMFEVGAKSIIEKILPTIDNFERGFAGLTDEQKEDPFVQGMEKVYRQMMTELENAGVKPIESVGQTFDPNFHNAVMHVEDEEAGENTVVEEFQKEYLYRDAVVRHSMVKVAN
jgi:molecular chaperone GrpE